ncbi:hypothetical protein L7F22_022495 [Adiantum nelumboides]|nr:hypothetical protein [Adiantum nelumboides]
MIGHIQDATSPNQAWDRLVSIDTTNTKARKIQLKNELNTVKKENLSINDYTLKIKGIIESLASIGVQVEDDDKVEVCMHGLMPAYKQFKTSIQTRKNIPYFVDLVPMLVVEEKNLGEDLFSSQGRNNSEQVFYSNRGRGIFEELSFVDTMDELNLIVKSAVQDEQQVVKVCSLEMYDAIKAFEAKDSVNAINGKQEALVDTKYKFVAKKCPDYQYVGCHKATLCINRCTTTAGPPSRSNVPMYYSVAFELQHAYPIVAFSKHSVQALDGYGALILGFFFSSSRLTKHGVKVKKELEGVDYKHGGQRNWLQVLVNSSIATVLSVLTAYYSNWGDECLDSMRFPLVTGFLGGILGHYACCNGDTWSSELGVLSESQPRLITTMRVVQRGVNGAVTLLGLLAATAGGAFIGLIFVLVGLITAKCEGSVAYKQWLVLPLGAFAGLFGSVCDSLLGATVQYSGFCVVRKKVVEKPGPTQQLRLAYTSFEVFSLLTTFGRVSESSGNLVVIHCCNLAHKGTSKRNHTL